MNSIYINIQEAMSKIEIKGNENKVYQNIKNSDIDIDVPKTTTTSLWVKYGAIIATISTIIAALANYKKIIQLF